jgi:hypothetical protein
VNYKFELGLHRTLKWFGNLRRKAKSVYKTMLVNGSQLPKRLGKDGSVREIILDYREYQVSSIGLVSGVFSLTNSTKTTFKMSFRLVGEISSVVIEGF